MITLDKKYSEDTKRKIQKEVHQFLEQAIDAYETSAILLENNKPHHAFDFLRQSACALIDACLSLYDSATDSQQSRLAAWEPLNAQNSLVRPPQIQLLSQILNVNLKDAFVGKRPPFEKWLRDYARILFDLRSQLLNVVKKELATQEQHTRANRQQRKTLQYAVTGMILMSLIVAGVFGIYLYLEPSHSSKDTGQLYWASSVNNIEEGFSVRFPITGDNQWQEVMISLPQPTPMSVIRFDPITHIVVEKILLDRIQLLDQQGKVNMVFDFNSDDPQWTPANLKLLFKRNGVLAFRPHNHDPYLISPAFTEELVSQVSIRILIQYQSQPFWQWILGFQRKTM